jgi:signal transduction histidine kinase
VEDATIDRVPNFEPDRIRILPGARAIELRFTALTLSSPETVRFRYRLEGFDDDWIDAGVRRVAYYNNLKPGTYTFKVQGSPGAEQWLESPPLLLEQLPFFYQTWWFRSLTWAAALSLALFLYRLRVHQIAREFNARLEERVSERTRLARDLHDTLLQSFHGLMLRFQVVSKMLPEGKAKEQLEKTLERADQAIAEGRNAVYDLRSSTTTTNDLAEALNAVANELSGEGTATFDLVLEGGPRDLHPIIRDELYRISREALLNAFKHARARQIEAEINYGERVFRLRIRDDGEGMPAEILQQGRPGHFGLPGMRERARQVGADLNIWSRAGTGTEIDLSLAGSIAYGTSPRPSRLRIFGKKVG